MTECHETLSEVHVVQYSVLSTPMALFDYNPIKILKKLGVPLHIVHISGENQSWQKNLAEIPGGGGHDAWTQTLDTYPYQVKAVQTSTRVEPC